MKEEKLKENMTKCATCTQKVLKEYLYDDGNCNFCHSFTICEKCGKIKDKDEVENNLCKKCFTKKQKNLYNTYKLCPFCGEKIQAVAIKCRFCNEMLSSRNNASGAVSHEAVEQDIIIEQNYKKIYIILFILLILPVIVNKVLVYSNQIILTEDLASMLTIMTKIGLIILTLWYSLKVRINIFLSILLGISTLLPFMPWVSLIILLSHEESDKQD